MIDKPTIVCTFDLEPWWTVVPPLLGRDAWDYLPDRSERPLHVFLDLCDEFGVQSTVFVVGEYARRYPERIRHIASRGHEIGCHSLFHDDLARQSLPTVLAETRRAKDLLEQAGGTAVRSFRAPSFSVPLDDLYGFYSILVELGFHVDSSLSSATRVYGGASSLGDVGRVFSLMKLTGCDITEVGIPDVRVVGKELTVFGGGYLRMTPTALALAALTTSAYHVLYLHAHDFDESCPRVPRSRFTQHLRRRLRIGNLSERVRALFRNGAVLTCLAAAEHAGAPAAA